GLPPGSLPSESNPGRLPENRNSIPSPGQNRKLRLAARRSFRFWPGDGIEFRFSGRRPGFDSDGKEPGGSPEYWTEFNRRRLWRTEQHVAVQQYVSAFG